MLLLSLNFIKLIFGKFTQNNLSAAISMIIAGIAIAFLTGAWFNHKLGGHTGDTYGAVVEWTEALFLCAMTIQ